MSKLFLGNGAASRYVCLVATLTGTQVERITADDAAAQLAKVSATAQVCDPFPWPCPCIFVASAMALIQCTLLRLLYMGGNRF